MAADRRARPDQPAPAPGPLITGAETGNSCKLHRRELVEAQARIVYGFFRFSDGFLAASAANFPNSKFTVSGGCVIEQNAKRQTAVRYCPVCRENHLAWARAQGSSEGLASAL